MDPVTRILSKFDDVKKYKDGWMVRCPAHEDGTPSCSIGRGKDGSAVVHCFAGCTTESILSALGLSLADLYEESGRNGQSDVSKPEAATIGGLARKCGLPQEYLVREKGLKQGAGYVAMPYRGEDKQPLFERKRMFLENNGAGPKFRQPAGVDLVPYGLEKLKYAREKGSLVLVEGECLTGDHEVLTEDGWVQLGKIAETPRVAQWDNGEVSFVYPSRLVIQAHEGALYQFSTQGGMFSQITTHNHKMVSFDRNGSVAYWEAGGKIPQRWQMPRAGVCYGRGWADWGPGQDTNPERLGMLIDAWQDDLDWGFIVEASADERTSMLMAVKSLGHKVKGRNSVRLYCGENMANWVQALAHTSGLTCKVNPRKDSYQVTLNLMDSRLGSGVLRRDMVSNHEGFVFCLTVQSGAFLVRHDGIVSVSGNSDSWTLDYNGIPHLGIPGANATGCLQAEHLKGIRRVYVVKETDKAGHIFTDKLGERMKEELGFKGDIRVIDMNSAKAKDVNNLWKNDPGGFPITFKKLAKGAPIWSRRKLSFKTASKVERQEVNWLWDPYIPFGFLSMVWGKGGIGKSFMTVDLIAKLSRGEPLPHTYTKHQPMDVLLFSCEEALEFQIVPHLEDAGADLSRVHVFDFEEEEFLLSGDYLEDLRMAIQQFDAKFIVMDPVVELMSDANINHSTEVRRRLGPLKNIARATGTAITLVHHQKKGQLIDPSDGATGSADFRNAVRSSLFVMSEPGSNTDIVCIAHEKHNMSAGPGDTMKFRFDDGVIDWVGTSPYTARDLIAESALAPYELDMVADATLWLSKELEPKGYAQLFKEVYGRAKGAGISKQHLFMARTRLGVEADMSDEGIRWMLPWSSGQVLGGGSEAAPKENEGWVMGHTRRELVDSDPGPQQEDDIPFLVPVQTLSEDDDDIWSWDKMERELR